MVAYQKYVVYAFIKLSAKSHSFNILCTMDGLSCPTIGICQWKVVPMSRDFLQKTDPKGWNVPVCLNMWVPPQAKGGTFWQIWGCFASPAPPWLRACTICLSVGSLFERDRVTKIIPKSAKMSWFHLIFQNLQKGVRGLQSQSSLWTHYCKESFFFLRNAILLLLQRGRGREEEGGGWGHFIILL